MKGVSTRRTVDYDELARSLEVMAHPGRLRLLHQLVHPKTVSEIVLQPATVRRGENPERPISRQAVELHLGRLESIGLLASAREPRAGAMAEVHTINYARLFALAEEFRSLGLLRPDMVAEELDTMTVMTAGATDEPTGPHFVIVHGLREGTTFPLPTGAQVAGRTWLIGRRRGLAVTLDYDPFVSAENSEVVARSDGSVAIRTLPESRNGTAVNWTRLVPGESRVLRHGDVVGVGRSLLLYRTA